jgi:hypothetical protein
VDIHIEKKYNNAKRNIIEELTLRTHRTPGQNWSFLQIYLKLQKMRSQSIALVRAE